MHMRSISQNRIGELETPCQRLCRRKPSTSSSPARARPAARWRRGCRSRAATGCCCSRPAGATTIPGSTSRIGYHKLYTHAGYNWKFESEPVAGLNGRTSYQPRGKMLGGTSSLNGMVYMRGTPADYDGWRQRGCEGWDYASVLPYFRKAEDQERGENEFHGVGGPLKVSDSRFRSEIVDAIIEAAVQAGIPRNPDFNGASQDGVGYYQTTVGNGRRWSTAVAYLKPARDRKNLVVTPNAHATRILIENGRAVGVEYRTPQRPRDGACQRRGDRLGRRLRLAAAAAAVGHRARRASEGHGARRRARPAGGRRQPARSLQLLRCLARNEDGHAQRSRPVAHAQDPGRHPVCAGPQRAALRDQHARGHPGAVGPPLRSARPADEHLPVVDREARRQRASIPTSGRASRSRRCTCGPRGAAG